MNPSRFSRHAPQGVALVVVLAFVVLLTGLIVAYFSRSLTGRQLSNNSAGQTRSAMLAQSATDTIIAGFKQEIKAGSTSKTVGASGSQSTIYVPTAGANAVPVRFPTPAPNSNPADPIPNLVRVSRRGDSANSAMPATAVPSYASAVNSETDAALDGRSVTAARWNSHFLIPTLSTAATTDSRPDATINFTSPDWVFMTRGGPAAQTSVGSGSGALNDASPSNNNFVVGRYAYAVYDEGGLLDMNVAGHPTPTAAPASADFAAIVNRKGSLAMADLTKLPTAKVPGANGYLDPAMVNSIVGWRNYASGGLSGASYPNLTFSSTQTTNWFANFVRDNKTGFMSVYGGSTNNTGATDQAFLSRQQLLKLRSSLGFSANVLQYMGTFGRSLEQPSYIPAHIRYPDNSTSPAPSINNVASSVPPTGGPNPDVNSYLGNNDAAGTQASSGLSFQDVYNPSFLEQRVKTAYVRSDGTKVNVGDPVVKRKFPLSRLAEIRYDATDNTQSITDATATHNHIKDWFGLSRTDTSAAWTYDHGGGSGGVAYILTLQEVASAGREPDFAELLKATINVGSLAKGGPNLHPDQGNYQYTLDTTVDYNVLQIMANLIDQYDDDSYPTCIKIKVGTSTDGSNLYRTFRGVEDLPYFYRYHPMTVVTRLPSPLLSKANSVEWHKPVEDPGTAPIKTSFDVAGDMALSDPGEAALLYIPDVWNPHDASTNLTGSSRRPARLRMAVIMRDPLEQTPLWYTGPIPRIDGDWYDDIPPRTSIPGPGITQMPADKVFSGTTPFQTLGTEASTAFSFSDDNGKLFREPTLLMRGDAPYNSGIVADPGSKIYNEPNKAFTDANTGVQYYGVLIGKCPISYLATPDASKYKGYIPGTSPLKAASTSGSYLFQAHILDMGQQALPSGASAQYTFRLQYQDPNNSSNWITYDEKYPDLHGLSSPTLIVNKTDFPNSGWMNFYGSNQMNDSATGYDPRTARFGIGTQGNLNDATYPAAFPFLEPGAGPNYNANNDVGNQAFAASKGTVVVTQQPGSDRGNHVNYSNPGMTSDPGKNAQMRWFGGVGFSASNGQDASPLEYSGLLAQNDQRQSFASGRGSPGSQVQLYYEDADGVNRRAMAAYYYSSSLPLLPSTYTTTNLQGLPQAIANNYTGSPGVGTPKDQNLSRPLILNRPFRSVAEMSYASRGGPWKQLDFFTPESGDVALLDVFCVNEIPADGIVAGKVNLNTRQMPVLQAILAGAGRDELNSLSSPPSYARAALTDSEATNVAKRLFDITTDTTHNWRGPLTNVSELVGRFVTTNPGPATDFTDFYTCNEPITGKQYTYVGLSASLDANVYTSQTNAQPIETTRIQRLRESAVRGLVDSGQTRVWDLMIDVVAQAGRFPPNASTLTQFSAEGESRYWIHVAIDRWTGEVIDKQIEVVNE